MTLRELARRVENVELFRALAPDLTIGAPAAPPPPGVETITRAALRRDGHARVPGALPADQHRALAEAIGRLRSVGIPPVFVLVYDQTWGAIDRLSPHLAGVLGSDWELLPDFWAWHVDPRRGERGWTPHRGFYTHLARADGTPLLLNVWFALTDATVANGCMHVVPTSSDPHFPHALESIDVDPDRVVPLPARAGDALLWNANALHFGGETSLDAEAPRVSISFSAVARSTPIDGARLASPNRLSFSARLDLVAAQITSYGEREPEVVASALPWARMISRLEHRP